MSSKSMWIKFSKCFKNNKNKEEEEEMKDNAQYSKFMEQPNFKRVSC